MAKQVLQLSATDIRCPARAWKVFLHGEGADDAGGVFDETISQMCEVSDMRGVVLFWSYSPVSHCLWSKLSALQIFLEVNF